jgi:hypothetical protein
MIECMVGGFGNVVCWNDFFYGLIKECKIIKVLFLD